MTVFSAADGCILRPDGSYRAGRITNGAGQVQYKGYTAAVEYDDSVGLLHGSVINSGPYPIVTFEAAGIEALREEFHRSIDDYLAWCEEDGAPPRLPQTRPASPHP